MTKWIMTLQENTPSYITPGKWYKTDGCTCRFDSMTSHPIRLNGCAQIDGGVWLVSNKNPNASPLRKLIGRFL